MREIEVSELPQQIDRLIEAVTQGEEVILTQSAHPLAKLTRIPDAARPRRAGSAKGQIRIAPDFDEPLDDFKEYMQ